MNPATVQMIMNIFAVVLVVLVVVAWVPWRKLGEKYFANDPTKGLLYIEIGEDTDCVKCSYAYSNEKGAVYYYNWRGNNLTVAVKKNYGYRWLHGRRMLRLAHAGDAWASYWGDSKVPPEMQKSAFDLDAVVRGNIGVKLVQTIYGAKKTSWLWYVLIACVVAAGYYFYTQGKLPITPATTPAPQQQIPDKGKITDGVPHAGEWELIQYV